MLTYNDEVLWPQNLGAVAIANYTVIIDTYHQIHINICLKVLTLLIILTRQKTNRKQHEFIDIKSSPCNVNTSTKHVHVNTSDVMLILMQNRSKN